MLAREENERVTRVGRGTPMGEAMRRYWIPALLAWELPEPDCPPVRVKLLGEELVAFRDSQGRIGILDERCPHRQASLFLGRNEEHGLRCVYHGWKFDVEGRCVDLPNAPEGPTFKEKIKVKCYPIVEAGQIHWAYMGPREQQPPFPELEWTDFPASHIYATKWRLECNYLQAMEGDFDQTHARFLHSTLDGSPNGDQAEPFARVVGSRRVRELPWTDLHESESGMWMITAESQPAGKSMASAHAAWVLP